MEELGSLTNRIRQAIDLRDTTYDKLARKLGVSQPAVAQWATGKKTPTRANLEALAEALEVRREWLERGEGEAPGRPADELRSEYQDAEAGADWIFRPAPPDGRDYGNANIWCRSRRHSPPSYGRAAERPGRTRKYDGRRRLPLDHPAGRGTDAFLDAGVGQDASGGTSTAAAGWHKIGRFLKDGLAAIERGDTSSSWRSRARNDQPHRRRARTGGNFAALDAQQLGQPEVHHAAVASASEKRCSGEPRRS